MPQSCALALCLFVTFPWSQELGSSAEVLMCPQKQDGGGRWSSLALPHRCLSLCWHWLSPAVAWGAWCHPGLEAGARDTLLMLRGCPSVSPWDEECGRAPARHWDSSHLSWGGQEPRDAMSLWVLGMAHQEFPHAWGVN